MNNSRAEMAKHTEHITSFPRIIVGGMQIGPQDPNPSALLAVSYPSLEKARAWAGYLSSVQNGVKPFESGPDVFVGDTAIRVGIRLKPDTERGYLCQVIAKSDPRHLTYAFYAASYVGKSELDAFYSLYDLTNNFVFTVSYNNTPLLDKLNLIKYTIDRRGV
ncbi:MAG: hypothetical protein ACOYEQ_06800 [Bacillota bacterium]